MPRDHNCQECSGVTTLRSYDDFKQGISRCLNGNSLDKSSSAPMETAYVFVSLAQLLKDFVKDIERLSGEIR